MKVYITTFTKWNLRGEMKSRDIVLVNESDQGAIEAMREVTHEEIGGYEDNYRLDEDARFGRTDIYYHHDGEDTEYLVGRIQIEDWWVED